MIVFLAYCGCKKQCVIMCRFFGWGFMRFQSRDGEILKWINGFGFATVEQI